jgi:hypothetical protein
MSQIDRELLPPDDQEDLLAHLNDSDPVWRTLGELVAGVIVAGIIAALTTASL